MKVNAKPIMIAGKGKPFAKSGKMAVNRCPEIYVITGTAGSAVTADWFKVHCLSHKDLKPLWGQDPLPPLTLYLYDIHDGFAFREWHILNNQILGSGWGVDGKYTERNTTMITSFDLGLNQQFVVPNPRTEFPPYGTEPEVVDMLTTEDGYYFFLTHYAYYEELAPWVEWVTKPHIYCFDKNGVQKAYWEGAKNLKLTKLAGSLESDGVFRLYAVGYDGLHYDGGSVLLPTTNPDWAMDVLYRFEYDFTEHEFTATKVYVDSPAIETTMLIDYAGRGFELFVPKAMTETLKTCYYISMIQHDSESSTPSVMQARISVIEDTTRAHVFNFTICKPDNDWDETITYSKHTLIEYGSPAVVWESKVDDNLNHTPAVGDWWKIPDEFDVEETYLVGDICSYGEFTPKYYQSTFDDSTNMSGKYIENWFESVWYQPGDLCRHDDKIWYNGYDDNHGYDPTTSAWWVEASEYQYAPDSTYGRTHFVEVTFVATTYYDEDGMDVLAGNPDRGVRESIKAALLYRYKQHFLYFRGCTSLYLASLFCLNLTTGTYQIKPCIPIPGGKKPKLMGVHHSANDPYTFDKLLMLTRDKLYLVNIDDLTTVLSEMGIEEVFQSVRPGYSGYGTWFIESRINRMLKANND